MKQNRLLGDLSSSVRLACNALKDTGRHRLSIDTCCKLSGHVRRLTRSINRVQIDFSARRDLVRQLAAAVSGLGQQLQARMDAATDPASEQETSSGDTGADGSRQVDDTFLASFMQAGTASKLGMPSKASPPVQGIGLLAAKHLACAVELSQRSFRPALLPGTLQQNLNVTARAAEHGLLTPSQAARALWLASTAKGSRAGAFARLLGSLGVKPQSHEGNTPGDTSSIGGVVSDESS